MFTSVKTIDTVQFDLCVDAPKNKLKILFYHAAGHIGWLYPAVLQLKTYIDLFYQNVADQLEWSVPIQQEISDDELIQYIEQTGVNVLCTSHYLWNHAFLTAQLSRIKNKLKHNVKVVAGGPSIDVNNNHNFFEQYPYIDYAVYGAGEQAFADIVNHLVTDKPLIAFNTSNCAWKNHNTGKSIVADYKFVKMIETSPFVHNKELFSAMVDNAKEKNISVWLPYTLTRGCPYSCTFCDWNSGLGNKVSRRKNTYQHEIDLFQQLGVHNIYLSDANVGQYDEDVEMIEYFGQKNLQENTGFHVGGNFSKLKKDNNLKIFHIMSRSGLSNKTLNFSIQDTNREVLKNINRPDVGWDVHLSMAQELQKTYPKQVIKGQLIYGLPGQTVASWRQTLEQVTQANILPIIFINEPLPASPAIYDPEYQNKFKFEYLQSNRVLLDHSRYDPLFKTKIYSSLIPKKSSSFDQSDLVHMNLLNGVYFALAVINLALTEHNLKRINIPTIVDDYVTTPNYQNLYNNLYHNWTVNNNFYYTIDYSGNKGVRELLFLFLNQEFLKRVLSLLPYDQKPEFSKLILTNKLDNFFYELNKDFD
jgi:tRNA A37 methylthiotransferase MiaB